MQLDTALLALLCGHFLGDFVLQTDRMVKLKNTHLKWMLSHGLQVALITWILLGNFSAWWIVGIVFFLHLLTDYTKKILSHESPDNNECLDGRNFGLFIGDQCFHIVLLIILWYCLRKYNIAAVQENSWELLLSSQHKKGLLLLTGLAVGISGVGVVLKYQMSEFSQKIEAQDREGLPKGGKTIGTLERLLVFMFVLVGKPEGVGFVIAAKSVFRIGQLTNKKEKDHAEYIMIGTLRSFAYALLIAFITKWLIEQI